MDDRGPGGRAARELAAGQHGLVSRWQLREIGLDPDRIHHLFRSPYWSKVTDEVAALNGSPVSTAREVVAAVLDAGPGAVLSHLPAGRWWGQRGCRLDPVEVVRVGATRRRVTRAQVHRVRSLPEAWVTELDGVAVVRPELLALQLFAVQRFERAERLVERLWSDRLLSGRSLTRFLDQYGRRGRNGTAGLRRYLEPRGTGYVPAASGIESRAVQILAGADICVRRQVDVGDDEHWTGRVDLQVVGSSVLIEVQSERHHRALVDREADERRLARLRSAGFTVVEVTDDEVWTRPGILVARIRNACASVS